MWRAHLRFTGISSDNWELQDGLAKWLTHLAGKLVRLQPGLSWDYVAVLTAW